MSQLTTKNAVDEAQCFIYRIGRANGSVYAFVGHPTPWDNDASPPAANDSIYATELSVYSGIAYGKRLDSTDVQMMAKRHLWTANTVYDYYDQNDADIYSKNFYVVTDDGNVFKCIWNAGGANSTIKPALLSTEGTFKTGDGYTWKFMYTVDAAVNSVFFTANYVPITANSTVEAAATPGSIDFVRVVSPGSEYRQYNRGYLASIVNSSVMQLGANASTVNNYYSNCSVYVYSSPGGSQLSNVTSYTGTSRLLAVDPPFDYYVTLELANVVGSFTSNDYVSETMVTVTTLVKQGYLNSNDVLEQTETGAKGILYSSNATHVVIRRTSGNTSFSNTLPIYDTEQAGSQKTGTATIASGSSNVDGTGSSFDTEYANSYFVRVGPTANSQIRRINQVVNSTFMNVTANFTLSLTTNNHYLVPSAVDPSAISTKTANGSITYVNLDGVLAEYDNVATEGISYVPGETVNEVDVDDIDLGKSAIVDYANATHLILSSVSSALDVGEYLTGESSGQKAQIVSLIGYPVITIQANENEMTLGALLSAYDYQGNTTGNAVVIGTAKFPGTLTEYIVSPRIDITGDGGGARGYAVINTNPEVTNSISEIVMLEGGNGYSFANVTVAPTAYGSGANLEPLIAPVLGHGSNAAMELGARYVSTVTKFDTLANEQYELLAVGSYRQFGLIKDPMWAEAVLVIGTAERAGLTIATPSGTFNNNEVVLQSSSNAAGLVVWSNSSYIELMGPSGTWTVNATGDDIVGLVSGTTANAKAYANIDFSVVSAGEPLIETVTEASMNLTSVTGANLYVANVLGQLVSNVSVYDPATNAYAMVSNIYVTMGTEEKSAGFGERFIQTQRTTITSNTDAFQLYERVVQDTTDASGVIATLSTDVDVIFSGNATAFNVGNDVYANVSGAVGVIIGIANSTHMKITATANGTWNAGDTIINSLGANAIISTVYPVLILSDVRGTFLPGTLNIVGNTSLATGRCSFANGISYPQLTRDTGDLLYIENVMPLTRSNSSIEELKVLLKF